uniref:Reverse transcriptase domain-containing protein n=1 Tax=Paramormyrops kingsleyae TaxID=1676925 RepID=A0A3B3QR15_9TELE
LCGFLLHGAKPGKLLALRLRQCDSFAAISCVKTKDGAVTTNPSEINDRFVDFYKDLYLSDTLDSPFSLASLPILAQQDALLLEAPITFCELTEALKSFSKNKAPGMDGIQAEVLLTFWAQLASPLFRMLSSAIRSSQLHPALNSVIISLLLKQGKVYVICSSYRPLSLMNSDVKLLAKVLARRLQLMIAKIVHPDQTGFISARYATDNKWVARQGCPLSPLLFILSLEPLAAAIRSSVPCTPIVAYNTSHKISLYADDVLLYLGNVSSDLQYVLGL